MQTDTNNVPTFIRESYENLVNTLLESVEIPEGTDLMFFYYQFVSVVKASYRNGIRQGSKREKKDNIS